MKNILLLTALLLLSCEKDDDSLAAYNAVMTLSVSNDQAEADGVDKVKITAEFPSDFSTEDDQSVNFIVRKETDETIPAAIRVVAEDGIEKKIAEAYVAHNKMGSFEVKAVITVNRTEISKSVTIHFRQAFFDDITIETSSLTIAPESFDTIDITAALIRDKGTVTPNTMANTVVVNVAGDTIGYFNNYKNKTDSEGKIKNVFTLGDYPDEGPLYIIVSSVDANGAMQSETLTIFSNN